MASTVIDLTNDESPRKPKSTDLLLYQAIDGTNKETLGALLKKICAENSSAKALVESEILASSDQVVPYHADTESEDDEGIEEIEAESRIKEESVSPKVKDDIRRQCARCPEAFTHAENEEMDECVYHTGTKEVNPDADAWYDYNDEAYGPEEIHIDDPAYAEGFKWSCCGYDGNDGGCQEGKHIAEGEEDTEIKLEKDLKNNLKRKADQAELEMKQSVYVPRYTTCENCNEQFDVTDNYRGACVWHTGIKMVDFDSDTWDDHDEKCHGLCESFKDDPDYQKGFVWKCCDVPGDIQGCKQTKHKALKIQERKKRRC